MNSLLLALFLALLPPEAHRLNAEAMAHYEAGRPEQALELFLAAYASVPADREQNHHREDLLGSIRGSLLVENRRSGAAAPLCRLHDILKAHVDSVRTIFADDLERPEVVVNVRRIGMVESQLADYSPHACDPVPTPPPAIAPAPVVSPTPPPADPPASAASDRHPAPQAHPAHRPHGPSPHHLRIAGGIGIGVGVALLGATTAGVVQHTRITAGLDARASELPPGQSLDPMTWAAVQNDLDRARFYRGLAIGTGVSAALALGAGAALFLVARGRPRARFALAPWWLSSGAGLTAQVRFP